MKTNISIRKATEKDIPFLIETIIAAEKSGTETFAYCSIFSLGKEEFTELLKNILEEDIQGQELCVSDFLIAEEKGISVGACCGWIEGENGTSSSLKANILHYFLGEEKIAEAQGIMKIADALHIEREADLKKAQIQLMKTNETALKAYDKLGFEIICEKHSDNPEILRILPSHHKVMMQKL